jgi:ABC-2 type transport system ATP-binding protein
MVPLLEARGVTRFFGPVGAGPAPRPAVDGVSLTLSPGELLVVHGPAASGKTTLLGCIAGLLRPDHGTVSRSTRDVLYSSPAATPYTFLTVRETVELYSAGEREAQRALKALSALGLGSAAGRRVSELADGARAGLMIARAVARAPELLLLDGLIDALPPRAASRALAALLSLAINGSGVVVATRLPERFAAADVSLLELRAGRPVDLRRSTRAARAGRWAPRPEPAVRHPAPAAAARSHGRAPSS